MKKIILPLLMVSFNVSAQILGPNVTGNTENMFQYLNNDTIIGAIQPEEKTTFNSYTYVNYNLKGFRAGARFESYLPHILGYPNRYSGSGIGYRYAGFSNDMIDVTAGNFYEQFGSGMTLRAYEARALGVDNALDGINIRFRPFSGAEIKAVYGKMRYEFNDGRLINADGFVRGIDGEFNLNTIIKPLKKDSLNPSRRFLNKVLSPITSNKLKINLGGSFVSKNQKAFHPLYNMPNNVANYGGRLKIGYNDVYIEGEYVIKEQDPSLNNDYIFNKGFGSILTAGYSTKGFGIILQAKSIDNMSYRVDPDATLTDLNINYLPASTKAHTYNLASTLYPYGTNLNGEVSFSADVMYKIPKNSKLGGKYGTSINVNYVIILSPDRNYNQADSANRIAYTTRPYAFSDSLFLKDFNIEIKHKFSKKIKATVKYFNFRFNNEVNQVTKLHENEVYIDSHIGVIDFTYKFNKKHSLRTELQGLFTKRDRGNWATALLEYNISPHWFFSVIDQYNYGNEIKSHRLHYLTGSAGYLFGSSRFIVSYGRQRAGIFCVGGVCRNVPATNGLTFTFVSSF